MGRLLALLTCALFCADAELARAHRPLSEDIEKLSAELTESPTDAGLLRKRARFLRLDGHLDRALADVDAAMKLAPDDRDVAFERGLILERLRRDAEADAELTRFLDSGPPSSKALAVRAATRARRAKLEAALEDYDASLALKDDIDVYLERGALLEAADRLDAAAAGYRRGLERLGGALMIRLALVRVEVARGRHDDALSLLDDGMESATVKTTWRLRRAEVLAAAGRDTEAEAERKQALSEAEAVLTARPTAINLYARARANAALERWEAAETDLRLTLERAPKLERARELLETVVARRSAATGGNAGTEGAASTD